MSKKWIFFIAVGVLTVIVVINAQVMPYYAFIHTNQEINESHLSDLLQLAGNTVIIPYVDTIYMGWSCLFKLLLPIIVVFFGTGYFIGHRVGNEGKAEDVKKELERIKSEKRVSVHGNIIGGFRAEELEECIIREGRRLELENTRLKNEKADFYQQKSDYETLEKNAAETAKQLENLKHDHANRGDKLIRLEKTNDKLEMKIIEHEQEIIALKLSNLALSKQLLVFENKT